MKRIHLFLCFIGCTVLSIAQNGIATLSLAHIEETHIQQSTVIQSDTVLALNYPETITGLSISGTATLNHTSNSLVRVTLQDDYNTEWLVYELFPLLADSSTVTFSNVAFETSVLENITAKQLNIKIINATLQLDEINTTDQTVASYSTLQNHAMEAQSSYIIDKLNENLEKRNIPWRAGETSVSRKTYEEKKAMFGGEVPNLGGLEYYKGGIFVMPDYKLTPNEGIATMSATEEEDTYVKEWDWRNRHGKNWMTPVKDQGSCGSCWAFATLGVLEAYTNLYYNQLLNLDLSEQELVSCVYTDNPTTNKDEGGCGGGTFSNAFNYIKTYGVMDEESFPYLDANGNCEDKPLTSNERIYAHNYTNSEWRDQENNQKFYYYLPYDINEVKKRLFHSPAYISIPMWQHDMVLTGFTVLEEGDTVSLDPYRIHIITEGEPWIGQTALIVKNSWGEDWGINGYLHLAFSDSTTIGIYQFKDAISSINHTTDDIVKADNGKDGYYFTGIVHNPPVRYPSEMDSDDTDPDHAVLDQYGNLQRIIPDTLELTRQENDSILYPQYEYLGYIHPHLIIKSGYTFSIIQDHFMYKDATITVEPYATLNIDSGSIDQADITVKAGGTLNMTNGAHITLRNADCFHAEKGSTVNIGNGCSIDLGE